MDLPAVLNLPAAVVYLASAVILMTQVHLAPVNRYYSALAFILFFWALGGLPAAITGNFTAFIQKLSLSAYTFPAVISLYTVFLLTAFRNVTRKIWLKVLIFSVPLAVSAAVMAGVPLVREYSLNGPSARYLDMSHPLAWAVIIVSTLAILISLTITMSMALSSVSSRLRSIWALLTAIIFVQFSVPMVNEFLIPVFTFHAGLPLLSHTAVYSGLVASWILVCRNGLIGSIPPVSLESVIENLSDVILVADFDLRIRNSNRQFKALTGYQNHELNGRRLELFTEDVTPLEDLLRSRTKRAPHKPYQISIRKNNGQSVLLHFNAILTTGRRLEDCTLVLIGKMPEKTAGNACPELESAVVDAVYTAGMVNRLIIPAAVINHSNRIAERNDAFAACFGRSADTGQVSPVRIPPELKTRLFQGQPVSFMFTYSAAGGYVNTFEAGVVPLEPEGREYIIHLVDKTECSVMKAHNESLTRKLEFLSETASEMVRMGNAEDVYAYIAHKLDKLIEGKGYVFVNSFDQEQSLSTTRFITGLGPYIGEVMKLLGQHPLGKTYKLDMDDTRSSIHENRLALLSEGLYQASFYSVPRMACEIMEQLLHIGRIFGMGIAQEGVIYGTVLIMMHKGHDLENAHLVETFLNQVSALFQKRRIEDERNKSEVRFDALIQNANSLILRVNIEGMILFANRFTSSFFGFEQDSLNGLNVLDTFFPEKYTYENEWNRILRYVMQDPEKHINYQLENVRRDGARVWVAWSVKALFNNSGEISELLMVGTDVTERRKIEQALWISEREKNAILNSLSEMVLFLNTDMEVLWANTVATRSLGLTDAEIIGRRSSELWKDREGLSGHNPVSKAMETGMPESSEISSSDGTVWISRGYPVVNDTGAIIGAVEVREDITERKRAEKEIREKDTRYRILFNNANDGILVCSLADTVPDQIQESNIASVRITGFSTEELRRMRLSDLISGEKNLSEYYSDRRWVSRVTEMDIRTKNGRVLTAEISSDILELGGRELAILIIRDVTERKKYEAEIQARKAELEELNRTLEARVNEEVGKNLENERMLLLQSRQAALGEMIGVIAHQWKNPLTALSLIIQNLEGAHRAGKLTDDYLKSRVTQGQEIVMHMGETIDDFRNFFRTDQEPLPFSPIISVRRILSIISAVLKKSAAKVIIEGAEETEALGYPNEFGQVILNLVTNAKDMLLERNRHDGLIWVNVSGPGPDNSIRSVKVTVTDNAGGITDSVLPRLFDAYFTTRQQGTGIGLYLSRIIIEKRMNGTITASNTTAPDGNPGAIFDIVLPAARKTGIIQ